MLRTIIYLISILSFAVVSNFSFLLAKTKITLIAGKDSHGTNAHNWGEGVDLLSHALTKESGLNIETSIHKGGWPTDKSILLDSASVVILSDGGGRHPINKHLKEFDELAEKGVGLVCVHYAVEVPKYLPSLAFSLTVMMAPIALSLKISSDKSSPSSSTKVIMG